MIVTQRLPNVLAVILAAGYLVCCQTTPSHTPTNLKSAESAALFDGKVRSVLEHRCIHCHHDYAQNGSLNFQDREAVFKGDANGPFLVPGNPSESRIWSAMFPPMKHPRVMPGDGWGLTQAEMKAFLKWIETGAYWPEGRDGRLKIKSYEVQIDGYL